jgi:hypothetical protein
MRGHGKRPKTNYLSVLAYVTPPPQTEDVEALLNQDDWEAFGFRDDRTQPASWNCQAISGTDSRWLMGTRTGPPRMAASRHSTASTPLREISAIRSECVRPSWSKPLRIWLIC